MLPGWPPLLELWSSFNSSYSNQNHSNKLFFVFREVHHILSHATAGRDPVVFCMLKGKWEQMGKCFKKSFKVSRHFQEVRLTNHSPSNCFVIPVHMHKGSERGSSVPARTTDLENCWAILSASGVNKRSIQPFWLLLFVKEGRICMVHKSDKNTILQELWSKDGHYCRLKYS